MTLDWRDYSKAAGKGVNYEHHGGAAAMDVIHLNCNTRTSARAGPVPQARERRVTDVGSLR